MKKALVIYHANCDDGFGAALAFWKYKAEEYDSVVYHPGVYGQPHPSVDKETDVFVLDFSYDPALMILEARQAKNYLVLDHHKSAVERWDIWIKDTGGGYVPENLEVVFDMSRSGAMLALHNFGLSPRIYNRFFDFLQDRDLWKFENKDTQYFTQYLRSMPQDFEVWDELATDLNYGPVYDTIIACGKKLKEFFDKQCTDIVASNRQRIFLNNTVGHCVNCTGQFASDIGSILAKESGTYGATYYRNAHDEYVFSLRSIGEFDVSALAARFGGGGHKNAAGFKLKGEIGPDIEIEPVLKD